MLFLYSDEFDYESMDPTKWKEQDHYKVLALDHLRHKATKDEIKKSCKNSSIGN